MRLYNRVHTGLPPFSPAETTETNNTYTRCTAKNKRKQTIGHLSNRWQTQMDPWTASLPMPGKRPRTFPSMWQYRGRCYTTKSMKRPGGVLCPSTYSTIIWYRPSARGHQFRPSIRGHQFRPSIKGHRCRPNTRGTTESRQTKNRARCERKQAKAHVGRNGEKNGGGGTEKEGNSAIGAGEPSG